MVELLPLNHPLHHPKGTNTLELPKESDVGVLLHYIGLGPDSEYFAMINNDHVPSDKLTARALEEGDSIVLIPPIKGG